MSIPKDILALQKRWKERGSLSVEEMQKLLDWNAGVIDQKQREEQEAGLGPLKRDELVEFFMPATTQGNAYEINGKTYQGRCTAPYGVFLELARMHQQDVLGLRELTQPRGSRTFGLKNYIEFVPPQLTCARVRKAKHAA